MRQKRKNRRARRAAHKTPQDFAPQQRAPEPPASARIPFTPFAFARNDALAVAALCILVAVAYFPATLAGFVWDDAVLTKARPVRIWEGLWQIWFQPKSMEKYEGHYWPLLYTLFWIEHKLWGFAPAGYHIVNLILHAAASALLWRTLVYLKTPGAWFAAAVFAVHPLHVESVAWVIGRKDILAALFFMGALLCYFRFVDGARRAFYGWGLGLFVGGLLCKSTVVTLPAALWLVHWWRRGRVTWEDMMRVLPFLILGLIITIIDWEAYKDKEVLSFDYTFIERALIAARALWFYAYKLVWPADLAVIYPLWKVSAASALGWACAAAGLAAAAALWHWRARIGRGPLACVLFFAVMLSPVLCFIDYGYMQFSFVADRYQYIACAGLIALLTGAALHAAERVAPLAEARRRIALQVAGGAVVIALGALTWQQAGIYRHAGTFFSHIIAHNDEARGAYHNYGDWLLKEERPLEALEHYKVSRQRRPDFDSIPIQMGIAYEKLGQPEKAMERYRYALQLNPQSATALNNLALLLLKREEYEQGLDIYRRVIRMDPLYANAHTGMGVALFRLNRPQEALRSFDRALELEPTLQEARINRDRIRAALQQQQQQQQAPAQ